MYGAGGRGGIGTFGTSGATFGTYTYRFGGFGQGTGKPPWRPTGALGGSSDVLMSISAMEEYGRKSPEELRVEDYLLNRKSSLAVGFLVPDIGTLAQRQQQQEGTGTPKWQATVHTNEFGKGFNLLISISAMEEYGCKSYEELRVEDYLRNRKSSLSVGVLVPAPTPQQQQQLLLQQGTGDPTWQATTTSVDLHSGKGFISLMSISAMWAYQHKSHEELRVEDYLLNRTHCTPGPAGAAALTALGAAGHAAAPAPAMFGGFGATQAPVAPSAAWGFNFGFNHFGGVGALNLGGAVPALAIPATPSTALPIRPSEATVAFGTAAPAVKGLFGAAPEATGVAGVVAEFFTPDRRQPGTGKWRATMQSTSGFGTGCDMIMSISGMEAYSGKSHEELRAEDYSLNRKNSLAISATRIAFGGGGSANAGAAATAPTAPVANAPAAGMFGGFTPTAIAPALAPALAMIACSPGPPSSSRETCCLDAVTIALSQACEGGDKRWYASTLELQLVSSEFCRACRRVPTLHVRLDDETPRSLWSSEAVIQLNERTGQLHTSRVPTVCAVSLSWALLTEVIAKDLWAWLVCLQLGGPFAIADLGKVVWPRMIKELVFDADVDTPVEEVTWPSSLKSITFGGSFNKPIGGVAWPAALKRFSFGDHFDQPVAGVVWPARLQNLSFGYNFNQPIADVLWPKSLKKLVFGVSFNQAIGGVVWPASLQLLSFGYWFNQSITGVVWPPSLQRLSFGSDFDQPIVNVVWPASMLSLTFGESFNQTIAGIVWPTSIQQLSFGTKFNRPITEVAWPACLQQLAFGDCFNKSIGAVVWPSSLRKLTFGRFFNRSIAGIVWPASLQQLEFGDHFNKTITGVTWPASLEELSFGMRFNQPIAGVVWPASLKSLSFKGDFNQPIDGILWPASLAKLSFGPSFTQPMDEFIRRRLSSLMF